jgi:flagellar hook-associated protein 2
MSTSSINLISSALDVTTIVDNLINADSAPIQRMQSQVTKFQNKVSAFQTLNTKLSTLSDKLNTILFGTTTAPLSPGYSFAERLKASIFSKSSVSSSDESIISATASNPTAGGSYSVTVSSLAQAKSSASSNFTSISSPATGTGTLIITTGTNSPVTVTIDGSNNTLAGVRDAINAANAGVTATIINDGTSNPYRLVITANDSGTANAFSVTENLSGGQLLAFSQVQEPEDAVFVVNGVSITKSSNSISDVIDGVTFNLKQKTNGSSVTLKVGQDTESIVSSLKDLISAYNDVNTYINGQFAYNTTTQTAGVLAGDSTLRNIQSSLQNQLVQTISNRFTSDNVMGQVGVEFNRDGSLSLNEGTLRSALESDPRSVAALFLGDGTPAGSQTVTDNRVSYNGKTTATQPGTYAIQVTGLAQQATVTGNLAVTTLSQAEILTINWGEESAVVPLSQDEPLATVLFDINTVFSQQGIAASATNDGTGKIKITTTNYGSSQTITVTSNLDSPPGSTGFQTTPTTATGVDISGTINGHAAVGSALTLTGAAGQPEEGLSLNIAQTSTGDYGSVTIAPDQQGVEGAGIFMNLHSMLNGITDPLSGPIHNSTDSLNQAIRASNEEISRYQDRLDIEREMLTAQYSQADEALRLMTVTQASLNSQLASLSSSR